jgi:hypothetical protein
VNIGHSSYFFQILIFIASLGEIAVFWVAFLSGLVGLLIGKFFILLGTGIGLLGFLIAMAMPGLLQGSAALALGTIAGLGCHPRLLRA